MSRRTAPATPCQELVKRLQTVMDAVHALELMGEHQMAGRLRGLVDSRYPTPSQLLQELENASD